MMRSKLAQNRAHMKTGSHEPRVATQGTANNQRRKGKPKARVRQRNVKHSNKKTAIHEKRLKSRPEALAGKKQRKEFSTSQNCARSNVTMVEMKALASFIMRNSVRKMGSVRIT